MKRQSPPIPSKVEPQMLDISMDELSGAIKLNIPWLDESFGKVESFVEGKGRRKRRFPAIYNATKKDRGYMKLFPDSTIGNFSYIEVEKQNLTHYPNQSAEHEVDFAIVFWFNFEQVYPDDHKNRTIENVKHDVFEMLNRYSFANFNVRFGEFVEGADNIYKGYDHSEIDNQFLMRPFGGFKIKGKMKFIKKCGGSTNEVVLLPTPQYGLNIYSLEEKLTGLKDYDGRDIYVSGKKYEEPYPGSTIEFPKQRSEMGRVVNLMVVQETPTFINVGDAADISADVFSVRLVSGVEGDILWFMWYTKP